MLKFYYLEMSNIIVPGGGVTYLQEQHCACNILNWKHLLKSNFQRPYGACLVLTIFMVLVCSGDLINCTECSGIAAVLQAGVH